MTRIRGIFNSKLVELDRFKHTKNRPRRYQHRGQGTTRKGDLLYGKRKACQRSYPRKGYRDYRSILVEFLGLWEELNNTSFNRADFEAVKAVNNR